jgi:hypothetical protein
MELPRMKLRLALFSLTIWGLVGCGTPGAPQPPSLHLPKPITDLKAVRKGDKVYLTWTAPTETTDGEGIRSEGTVLVCRALQTQAGANCRDKAGQVPLKPTNTHADRRQTFVDDVAPVIAANDPRDFFTYNVIAANGGGKTAGASNPVTVFLAPSMPPAQNVRAEVQPDTVVLTWTPQAAPAHRLNAQFAERVYRTAENGEPVLLATLGSGDATYKDTTFTWEKPYTYTVVGVTKVLSRDGAKTLDEFEGQPSAPVTVTPHDTFPPAAPQALQAVYSSGFVDLAWHPNTESDIAGYNVYRQFSNGAVQKLNDKPVGASAFRDDKLQGIAPGTELTYFVTAVDTQGNESERSQPATERVPKP